MQDSTAPRLEGRQQKAGAVVQTKAQIKARKEHILDVILVSGSSRGEQQCAALQPCRQQAGHS